MWYYVKVPWAREYTSVVREELLAARYICCEFGILSTIIAVPNEDALSRLMSIVKPHMDGRSSDSAEQVKVV